MRLQTLHTFDQRQTDKKTKRQKDKNTKTKKTKRQNDKKTKSQKEKIQGSKREFNIATSGQFRTLVMFLI